MCLIFSPGEGSFFQPNKKSGAQPVGGGLRIRRCSPRLRHVSRIRRAIGEFMPDQGLAVSGGVCPSTLPNEHDLHATGPLRLTRTALYDPTVAILSMQSPCLFEFLSEGGVV